MLRSAISAFTRVFDALCLAVWCAADPGSMAGPWVPAQRRITTCCVASGTRDPSVVEAARAAPCLDVAATFLALEPPLFRCQRRPGRPPRNRARHRLAQQFDQPIDRISAVALLGAEALRVNHDHAVLGHAVAGEPDEARLRIRRQRDPARVEAQLRGSGELVDVLAARPGGAHEGNIELVLVDHKVAGNPQHGVTRRERFRYGIGCMQDSGFVIGAKARVLRTQRSAIRAFTRVFDVLCLAAWCAADPGSMAREKVGVPALRRSAYWALHPVRDTGARSRAAQFARVDGAAAAAAGWVAACGARPTITVRRPWPHSLCAACLASSRVTASTIPLRRSR